jgi:hypothetical protein
MEQPSWRGHFRNLGVAQPELALALSIEDDYNASSSWAFCFSAYSFGRKIWRRRPAAAGSRFGIRGSKSDVRGLRLELKRNAKIGWLAAGCAVALACACISPRVAVAQAAPPTPDTSTPAAKPHPASHASSSTHSKSTTSGTAHSSKSKHSSTHKGGKKKTTARGQQKIEPERAQAIQEALIREHYMTGEAAGTWNQSSEDAMRRYQADHGWQSKTVPDARALISLGLGPSHDHLLNPESAMTTEPPPTHAASLTPVSHSPDPGAHMNATSPVAPQPAAPSDHNESGPQ